MWGFFTADGVSDGGRLRCSDAHRKGGEETKVGSLSFSAGPSPGASSLSQHHVLCLGKCLLTSGPNYWLFADLHGAEASSKH